MKKLLLLLLGTSSLAYASNQPKALTAQLKPLVITELICNHPFFKAPYISEEEKEDAIKKILNSQKILPDFAFRLNRLFIYKRADKYTLQGSAAPIDPLFNGYSCTIINQSTNMQYKIVYGTFPSNSNNSLSTNIRDFITSNPTATKIAFLKDFPFDPMSNKDSQRAPQQADSYQQQSLWKQLNSNIYTEQHNMQTQEVHYVTCDEKPILDELYKQIPWLRFFKYHAQRKPVKLSFLTMLILGLGIYIYKEKL